MVVLDGRERFVVPGRGEREGAMDLLKARNQILLQGTGATSKAVACRKS